MKILLSIVFLCCAYVSSVMRSSWHFSTSGYQQTVSQDPPKIKKKLIRNLHQITSIFYMLLEDSFGVKSISKFAWGLEAYIKKCLWALLTHVYWFRLTGGYICGCGRPSNLVLYLMQVNQNDSEACRPLVSSYLISPLSPQSGHPSAPLTQNSEQLFSVMLKQISKLENNYLLYQYHYLGIVDW